MLWKKGGLPLFEKKTAWVINSFSYIKLAWAAWVYVKNVLKVKIEKINNVNQACLYLKIEKINNVNQACLYLKILNC